MQATIQGFEAKGLSTQESEALLKKSVEIALEARNIYYGSHEACSCEGIGNGGVHRSRTILVAASVGSYGAYLADGSEYRQVDSAIHVLWKLQNYLRIAVIQYLTVCEMSSSFD